MKILEKIIDKLLGKSPIVVYGEKKVGKTTFLLNLAVDLSNLNYLVFFGSHDKLKNIDIYHPNKRYFFIYNKKIISPNDFRSMIYSWLNKVKDIVPREPKIVFIIDNIIWRDYLFSHDIREFLKDISDLFVLFLALSKLFARQFLFMISAPEDIARGLPFNWRIFVGYGFTLLRIERLSRVRKISIVSLEKIGDNYHKSINELSFFILQNNKKLTFLKYTKIF